MTSRREVMQYAVALGALGSSIARAAAPVESPASGPIGQVVVDPALEGAAQFLATARRHGAAVSLLDGDLGRVWMNEIEPRWRRGPTRLAGFTGGGALFCLELFARDYGMQLAYRIEHAGTAAAMQHSFAGPAPGAQGWSRELAAAGAHWSSAAAAFAIGNPGARCARPNLDLLDLSARCGRTVQTAYSWVIAPRRRSDIDA